VGVLLGTFPGESAMPTCPACGTRFHAHRGAGGLLFTRPWGGEGATSIRVACPHCANQVPLTIPREGVTVQVRYCLNCFAELQIDSAADFVVVLREPQPPTDGALVGQGRPPSSPARDADSTARRYSSVTPPTLRSAQLITCYYAPSVPRQRPHNDATGTNGGSHSLARRRSAAALGV
jgi:hypothetical protein